MSHTLNIKKEILATQPLNPILSKSGTRPEMIFEVSSTCSCPQCNSIDCFKIRYENANIHCTCPSCKYAPQKNVQSKKPSDENYRELVEKTKDAEDKPSLNITTTPILKSDDEFNGTSSKDVVREVAEKDSLDTNTNENILNKKSDEKLVVTLNTHKENNPKDRPLNIIKRDLSQNKFDEGSQFAKEYVLENSLNCEIHKKDLKEKEKIFTLNSNIKNDLKTKIPGTESYLEVTKKVVKEREQKDSLNHEIIKKYIKEAVQRDTLNRKIKSDFIDKKSDDQFNSQHSKFDRADEKCCSKCGNKRKHKDSLNSVMKHSRSYDSNKNNINCCETNKRHDKRLEQKSTLNTCCKDDLPHKTHDDVRYRKITKKCVDEHVQTDTLDKHIKKGNAEVDLRERTNFRYKDTTFIKDKVKKTKRSYEESYTRNYSVAMTYTRKEEKTELKNPAASLSAQIMDLPYQDFKDSVSLHKSAGILNSSNITKQDILSKLKEIYKACSCKVCECIPSFSGNYVSKDVTFPCEDIKQTKTCNNQLDRQIPQRECQQLPHSGCPCYRCDRKDCRGVWKNEMEAMNCDCKPCECVQFTPSFAKQCDCEPCQCVECTPLNTHLTRPVIVAPVQGNFQQSRCQCEPCECANCTQNYGAMASSLMREASTGMVSQRNCNCSSCVSNVCQFDGVDCRCDTQNRIVRKPIDRSGRDYDLRQAILGGNSFSRKPSGKFKNNDTIAMFTFADNTYSDTGFNKSEDDRHGMDCEFSFCEDEEERGIKIKNTYEDEDTSLAFSNISDKSLSVNKCQPCECRWCCRNEEAESDVMKTTRSLSDCSCNICNCMACNGLVEVFVGHNKSTRKEIQFYKSIRNGEDFIDNIRTKFHYPLKKGKLLTPAMFESKIRSPTKTQMQPDLSLVNKLVPSNAILKLSKKNSSKKILSKQNLKVYHSNSVKKIFNDDHNQSRYKTMNDSKILSKYSDSPIDNLGNNLFLDPNKQNNIENNGSLQTNFILPNATTNYANHSETEMEAIVKKEGELFNSHVLNVRRQSKVRNSDADIFFSRIETLEKSLSQLQEDISLNRKKLAEIWSKEANCNEKCSDSNTKLDFEDNIIKKSHENCITDAKKYINEKSNKLQKLEHKTQAIVNKGGITLDGTNKIFFEDKKFDQNDSFSKGDIKMHTNLVRQSPISVTKSKKNITKSKFKKLSKNSNNKVIDFITEHLKENYRQHGNNKLNRKCTKSASTSYENCSVHKQLKYEDDTRPPPKDINESHANLWSVLRKNLYVNDTTVTYNDNNKTDCNIPELEINTKCTVQAISLQTNETRGHAALAKLQSEVSKLLNSPLLQLGHIKTYLTSNMDKKNISDTNYCRPKTKLNLELKHFCCDASSQTNKLTLLVEKETNCDIGQSMENMKIDITKLLDFLLTRTVCKSELTRPLTTLPERFRMPIVNYVKSSCEGLKASFLAVRKVSDHTVLLRWKVPREVENIQGYELQVDGRTVQQILSPTRCIAVLTCLPHCDKILLTVRTLTLSELASGHRPAATIVYYPREKHSRHQPSSA